MKITYEPLERLLDFVSGVLDGHALKDVDDLHRRALDYKSIPRLPIIFSYPIPEDFPFQPLPNGEIYKDPQKMLYNELISAWGLSIACRGLIGDDLPATIRPNWGTVLVSSILGAKAEQIEDGTPWIRHDGHPDISLDQVINADIDLSSAGWVPRVLDTYDFYLDVMKDYPELNDKIHITLPDLQGPLDNLELVRGSELFIELLTEPEKVSEALRRTAEIQIECINLFNHFTLEHTEGITHQHGFSLKGNVLLRNDSAVMVSPQLYKDIIAPWDDYVLAQAGGGGIHSCGKTDHVAPHIIRLQNLDCFDFGQSFMNDVPAVYSLASSLKVPLLRIQPSREDLLSGEILKRYPTGVSLFFEAESLKDAQKIFDRYRLVSEKISC